MKKKEKEGWSLMKIRIDKLLANMGHGSRKDVKLLLKAGAVRVDGLVVKDGKTHVNPQEQQIELHGKRVMYKPYIYLMMNKPQGVISATEDEQHRTVIDLLEEEHAIYAPFPVGRLDKDTTGLLLLTNDGQFSHALMSPRRHVKKTYWAKINGVVDERDVESFEKGVTLDDGYVTKSASLVIRQTGTISLVELTITEGKFHQVKRMFEAVGKKVISLERIKIGELELDRRIERGSYRELTEEEFHLLTE